MALVFAVSAGADRAGQGALAVASPERCGLEPAVTSDGAARLPDWQRYGDFGLCQFQKKQYGPADAAFRKAESLMPRSDRQLYEVGAFPVVIWSGASLLAAHQTQDAVRRFRRVSAFYDHAPNGVIAPENNRGTADQLFTSGHYRAAFEAYHAVYFENGNLKLYDAQFWGTPEEATFERALSAARSGEFARAAALLDSVLRTQPDFADARFVAALVHYARGDASAGQRALLQIATTRFFRSAAQPPNPAALQLSAIRILVHRNPRAQSDQHKIL